MKKKFKDYTIDELRNICIQHYNNDGRCDKECPFYRERHSKGKSYQQFCYPILQNLELLEEEQKEEEFDT